MTAAATDAAASPPPFVVAAFYRFTAFEDPDALRRPLARTCCAAGVTGTILLASEGVNGTIAGSRAAIDAAGEALRALPGCADLDWKESRAGAPPFSRLKVRLKREIVTMGEPAADPATRVGTYVDPADWNDVLRAEDVVVIDARNDYETRIGSFEGAIDPQTKSFTEFPDWWRARRGDFVGKRVAMFCTGGIRCEKASSWLLTEGAEEVLHLKGGILKYLEETTAERSLWRGDCFVFDERVSIGHGLTPGPHTLCRACGGPLTAEDRASPVFEEGVACPHCADAFDEADRERFRERQRQIALARARGERHLGPKR
ncbi:MAG: rhodanese-related sulfurtransferase [Pseudomonadota bacterium]